ncbi:MAG: endopeptidase La [Leptospiraceae bacterium]|nr:endopeptidase La [Leptospiraceae bacterium]
MADHLEDETELDIDPAAEQDTATASDVESAADARVVPVDDPGKYADSDDSDDSGDVQKRTPVQGDEILDDGEDDEHTPVQGDEILDDGEEEEEDLSAEAELISAGQEIVSADASLPGRIVIVPVPHRPVFPGLTIPVQFSGKHIPALLEHLRSDREHIMGLVLTREINEKEPLDSDFYEWGTAVRVLRIMSEDDSAQILLQTLRRFRFQRSYLEKDLLFWDVEYFRDPDAKPDAETKAYTMAVLSAIKELLKLNPLFQEQLKMLLANFSYNQPGLILDLTASLLSSEGEELQEILEATDLIERSKILLRLLQKETQLSQIRVKIQKSIEEKVSKQQKDFFLREQLKAIKQELGLEKDDKSAEIEKFQKRLEKLQPSEEARKVIDEEINKLSLLEPASPEYNVSRNYLDWLTILPWGLLSEDSFDIQHARETLDRDHYGLKDVKERILEFISTGIKTNRITGSILCLVGPPGTGKTSIGKSVAAALNRQFYRFSVGGMRDEAEIKGHRRTYIGAMPGKFLQSMKSVGTANPVIMLDEIDKIGASFHGDPASALLEVLDPEQNADFLDHYLDVRFDLSRVLFITTANQIDTIPGPLLDRMEVIKLSGYIMEEKLEIANRYLIPRTLQDHGLQADEISFSVDGLRFIIDRYAREAGVRNLENKIKKIMRKLTLRHAEGQTAAIHITKDNAIDFLGQPVFSEDEHIAHDVAGVVTGLAWTSMGGATLSIEAIQTGKREGGALKLTGQLGEVMQESAQIAWSIVKSKAPTYKLDPAFFKENEIHLHVPAGATPKDGPSAGITMTLALYSLASNQIVPENIAMTGEISLTGKVLPVGGIREKIIAARRTGVFQLILPRDNLKDYKELPDYIRSGLKVFFVSSFEDVLKAVFGVRP